MTFLMENELKIDESDMPEVFSEFNSKLKKEIEKQDWFNGGEVYFGEENPKVKEHIVISANTPPKPEKRVCACIVAVYKDSLQEENIVDRTIINLKSTCERFS